jgi:F-type H+-transporting ATPase subunit a
MGGAIIRDLGRTLAHLVPQGTPYPLIPLIVLIELVRNFIRPATLSIRLAANMVAGHLLLTLAGGSASILSPSITLVSMVVITLIIVLELAVALIQSYVFSTLSSLYIGDVNSVKTAI